MRLLRNKDNEQLSRFLVKAFRKAGYDVDLVTAAQIVGFVLARTSQARRARPFRAARAQQGSTSHSDFAPAHGIGGHPAKPAGNEEAIARKQTLLGRAAQRPEQSLKLSNLELRVDAHGSQILIDGHLQILPPRDLLILEILLARCGRVVSTGAMLDHLSVAAAGVSRNAVWVYVHRLRKQLKDRGAKVSIHTVTGVGYIINERQ